MLKKVAVDRLQINKLIKLKKYKEAIDYINHVRKVIDMVSISRVNRFIENKIILKEEKGLFVSLIQNNINNKLLEEETYILIDEEYVDLMIAKLSKIKEIRDKKKQLRKKQYTSL